MPIRLPAGSSLVPFLRRLGPAMAAPKACWRQEDGGWVVALSGEGVEKALCERGAHPAAKPRKKPDRGPTPWPELVPLEKSPLPDPWNLPTLILVDEARRASVIAGNILALGHDGARLGRLGGGCGRWAILGRGLPLFVLLGLVNSGSATVLVDQDGKGAWFPAGFRHPLASGITPEPGCWVLCHAGRPWESVLVPALEEIERHARFSLGEIIPLETGGWSAPIEIALRLERRIAPEPPTAWWHPGSDTGELERWLARVPPTELSNYLFAVVTGREPGVMMRWRPIARRGRTEPPPGTIPLASIPGMEGIYLPCDRSLAPCLAPMLLRRAFQSRPGVLRVVVPEGEDGGFRVLALPDGDGDFKPLDQWVRYVIHQDEEVVPTWKEKHTFDFDSLIVAEPRESSPFPSTREPVNNPAPPRPTPKKESGARKSRFSKPVKPEPPPPEPAAKPGVKTQAGLGRPEEPSAENREMETRRTSMARAYWEVGGRLNGPERVSLLGDLAMAENALGNPHEAARLLAMAVWETDSREHWRSLFASEVSALGLSPETGMDDWVPHGVPGRHWAVWAAGTRPEQLPDFVESYLRESCRAASWPIRHSWWAASSVSRSCGGDLLLVAEARDRVVARLVGDLRLTGDMPFLLTEKVGRSGSAGREALVSMVGDQLTAFLAECETRMPDKGRGAETRRAVLALGHAAQAVGLALLGSPGAEEAMNRAQEWDRGPSKAADSLLGMAVSRTVLAFSHRFNQARSGGLSGPLPDEGPIPGKSQDAARSRYIFSSFCEMSRLLEPDRHVNPFEAYLADTPECLTRLRQGRNDQVSAAAFDECLRVLDDREALASRNPLILQGVLEKGAFLDEGRAGRALAALLSHVETRKGSESDLGLNAWVLLAAGSRLACHWNLAHGALQRLMVNEAGALVRSGMQGSASSFLSRIARRMLACGRREELGEITGAVRDARLPPPAGEGATLVRERADLALDAHLETVSLAGGGALDGAFWARLNTADFSRPPADLPGRDATVGLLEAVMNLRSAVDESLGTRLEMVMGALLRSLAGETDDASGRLVPGCVGGVLRGIEVFASQPLIAGSAGRDSWIMDELEASLRARVFGEFAGALGSGGM